jgi:beta-galactosidase
MNKVSIRTVWGATLLFLSLFSLSAQESTNITRQSILFNFGWKFHAGQAEGAHLATFNDANWRNLDLPHDFQFDQPWLEDGDRARGFKAMGEGWYRKSFKANADWKGKKVLLDFEGIMLIGDVWLNGDLIGSTEYGYVGFDIDISQKLNYDADNVLVVRASTGNTGSSRWYTGGGLYRDVNLVVTNPVAVTRNGVYITTPTITNSNATVKVQVEVEGFRYKRDDLNITARIYGPNGQFVAETYTLAPKLNKLQFIEVPLPSVEIANPQLWSCETPNLYIAEITLTHNGQPVDKVTEKFGIRTIEFSNQFGFKLNGKKVFLKGIANHHDLGAVGAAAYESAIARQMDLLKQFGYNHIRTSHNPYSKSFMRLADEKGILLVDELYDKWSNNTNWGGRMNWTDLWPHHLKEWVKRDRNHPSVIMWSLGNELQMREDLAGYPTGDWGITTYRMMDVLVKRYDATRPTTVAMFHARANALYRDDEEFNTKIFPPELATVTEVSSFNYRWFNYKDFLQHAPHMIMYQSEATTNELLAPYWGMNRDNMVGLAYWGAIEYWGESHGWPRKGWAFSFFNHALEPFPHAYLIKSAFSDEPLVHIGVVEGEKENLEWNDVTVGHIQLSSNWNRTANSNVSLFTFTNADEVELLVNGKSIGKQANDTTDVTRRNVVYWQNVPYVNGGNVVAVARTNGKEVARHQLVTTGKAVALKLEVENANWRANGMDLQYVKVYAVDSKGRVVPNATGKVVFDVTGAAKLLAIDNGDHTSNMVHTHGNTVELHKGFALAILRAGQMPGTVRLKASAEGFKKAERTLMVK